MGGGKHAAHAPVALGDKIVGVVPECALDYALPSTEVKECAARVGEDEIVPLPLVAGSERPYGDAAP